MKFHFRESRQSYLSRIFQTAKAAGEEASKAAIGAGVGYYATKTLSDLEQKRQEKKRAKAQAAGVKTESRHLEILESIVRTKALKLYRELEDVRDIPREIASVAKPAVSAVKGIGKGIVKGAKALAGPKKNTTNFQQYNYKDPNATNVTPPQPGAVPANPLPTTEPKTTAQAVPQLPNQVARPAAQPPKNNVLKPHLEFADFQGDAAATVSNAVLNYVDGVYTIFSGILEVMGQHRREGTLSPTDIADIKRTISKDLLDYYDPLAIQRMSASLDRLKTRIQDRSPVSEASLPSKVGMSAFQKLHLAAVVIGAISSAIFAVMKVKSVVHRLIDSRRDIKQLAQENQRIQTVFKAHVIPRLEKILEDILDGTIVKHITLIDRIHGIVDHVGKEVPSIQPYVSTWKPS